VGEGKKMLNWLFKGGSLNHYTEAQGILDELKDK
jgi:hypothetical protein